jgi:putative acetyltransferase
MKSDDYFIRSEGIKDIHSIRVLNQAAFVNGENEVRLVELIRDSENFIPDLSLVAVYELGKNIGHILFSVISLLAKIGVIPTIGLAPMAVKPEYQNSGIGSALVKKGLNKCKSLG